MYAFGALVVIGHCILEGNVSKEPVLICREWTAGSATWLHMCTEQTSPQMRLKSLQTPALNGFASHCVSMKMTDWLLPTSLYSKGPTGIRKKNSTLIPLTQTLTLTLPHMSHWWKTVMAVTGVWLWFSNSNSKTLWKLFGKYVLILFWITWYQK